MMSKHCAIAVCALMALAGMGGAAFAAETAATETRLKEEVVVAPPVIEGNQVTRYGGTKTIVGADQVNDLNAQDVTNALRTTPGVTISRYDAIGSFGGGEGGAVFIRGLGAGRPGGEIKTTIDGVNLGNPVFNHGLMDLMPIDPAGRVEVIKGVQPTEQGSGFGGVNIVPKRMTEDGYKTKAGASYGSFNTYTQTLEHGGKEGALDYYVGQGYRSSSGHREHSEGSLKDAYGGVGYQLSNNWDLRAFVLGTDNMARDPGTIFASNQREERYKTSNTLGTLTLSNKFDAASGELKLYGTHIDALWRDQAGPNTGDTKMWGDNLGLKAKEAFTLWQGGEVLAGFDFDRVTGSQKVLRDNGSEASNFGNKYTTMSPRLAVSQFLGDKGGFYLTPSVGVRYFDNSIYGSEWAPHAGLVGGYKDTEAHFSVARGINYPGLEVLAMGRNGQNLDPEIMHHMEFGVAQKFTETLKADLTFFTQHGDNRYARVNGMTTTAWVNTGHYDMQGVEGTVNWAPTKTLALYTGVTWLDHTPTNLPYAPEWTASAGGNWAFAKDFKLSVDAQYVDSMYSITATRMTLSPTNSQKTVQYFLLNAKLSWFFDSSFIGGKGGELFLAGDNLTNSQYTTRPDYPMPGIGGTVGMNLTF
jgi:iron complex outermembrane receptor protein